MENLAERLFLEENLEEKEEEEEVLAIEEVKKLTEIQQNWNDFVTCIIKAKEIWDTKLVEISSRTIDMEGQGIPKIYSSYRLSKFVHFMPRFLSYARAAGGVQELLTKK